MNLLSKRTIILLSLLALLPLVVFAGCSATDSSGNSSDNGTGDSSGPPVAPDFTMTTLDGNEVSFSDYKGKPILLNFAASWCGPCESEAPILAKAYERYKDQVVFLGVAVKDNVDSQRAFAQKHGLTFPIGGDPNGDIVYSYQKAGKVSLSGIPTTFFINKDGQIESFWVGPLSENTLDRMMAMIIN